MSKTRITYSIENVLVENQITLEKAFPENSTKVDALFQRGYEDATCEFGFAEPTSNRPEETAAYCYGYILGKYAQPINDDRDGL